MDFMDIIAYKILLPIVVIDFIILVGMIFYFSLIGIWEVLEELYEAIYWAIKGG